MPTIGSKRLTLLRTALANLALLAAPLIALAPAPALAQPEPAQVDPYKQHMDNGIKLYQDGNYLAAITEFQAAYNVKPKASPLLNIALCYKAKFNYPKAIKTLETALERHGDTMDASDKEASESAIRDMRALLAYVTVKITPPQATLVIDDEEQPQGAAAEPVPIGPGPHKIAARAEGFAQAEQRITVASGDKPVVKLALVPDKGWVNIIAADPRMTIAVDQRVMSSSGQWAGMLSPGTHIVQMYGPGGAPFTAQILVVAGKQLNVRPGMGGVPVVPVTPPQPPPKKLPPPTPPRRGFYALAQGSVLFPLTYPPSLPTPTIDYGAAYGLRLGFQVNSIAGFDISYQHSSISSSAAAPSDEQYRFIANRLAIGLRLISSGKAVRFVGSIGGGPVFDDFTYNVTGASSMACASLSGGPTCPLKTGSAIDAFAYMEGGFEIDLDHVLIDLGLETQFEATGNIGDRGKIYNGGPLVNIGPALRVGYRFW